MTIPGRDTTCPPLPPSGETPNVPRDHTAYIFGECPRCTRAVLLLVTPNTHPEWRIVHHGPKAGTS